MLQRKTKIMNKITLLVPTFNRHDFLTRLLRYYYLTNSNFEIIVGDASSPDVSEDNKEMCIFFNAKYIHLPNLPIAETIKELNKYISTEYVALLPDDDIYFTDSLLSLANILDCNKDVISANGNAGMMILKKDGAFGKIHDIGDYKQTFYTDNSPNDRLRNFINNYSVVLFGLYRKEQWVKMWEHVGEAKEVGINAEIIPCMMSVVLGKTVHINIPYMLRQEHKRRILGKYGKELVESEEFLHSCKVMLKTISNYASQYLVIEFIDKYCKSNLNKKTVVRNKKPIPILSWIKIQLLNRKRMVSLPRLRRHCKDFNVFEKILKGEI